MAFRPKDTRRKQAERLRRLRGLLNLTQGEMAEEFGVVTSAISQWESAQNAMPGPAVKLMETFERDLGIEDPSGERFPQRLLPNATALALLALFVSGGKDEETLRGRLRARALAEFVRRARSLRGLSIKMAQFVSALDLEMPDHERRALDSLGTSATPVARSQLRRVFLADFGLAPDELFASFTDDPFATGSVGQVHRARLRTGEPVAVKVQYPTMRVALESDLRPGAALDQLLRVFMRRQEPGVFYDELVTRFLGETDYALEAHNHATFARHFADRRDMRFPRLFVDHCSTNVITASFEQGTSLDEFARTASQEERNRVGLILWNFFQESVFDLELLQADPHPGNFLFSKRGVTFLDFGRVQTFEPGFVELWRETMRSAIEGDRDRFRSTVIALGVAPVPKEFDFEHGRRACLVYYKPWLTTGRFRFTRDYLGEIWRAWGPENRNNPCANYPRGFVFMSQFYFGAAVILARLGAEIECRPTMMRLLYGPGARTPPPFTQAEVDALMRA